MRRERATSPTPSQRPISTKRVNTERDLTVRAIEDEVRPSERRLPPRFTSTNIEDSDSIVYKPMVSPEAEVENELIPERTFTEGSSERGVSDNEAGLSSYELTYRDLLPYYLPVLSWIRQYNLEWFIGDLIGGCSLATFQIPLVISYSTSLAKVPIACGLYSLAVAPFIYLVFGSVPQMIVGPEAPISLIVGQAVEPLMHHAKSKNITPTDLVVVITSISGATLLGFGIGRFGFLDNVLCESLLKGFICGVGMVMVINSSISMAGLNGLLEDITRKLSEIDIHSPFDKFKFLITHWRELHVLTFRVSLISFLAIMLSRLVKSRVSRLRTKHLQKLVYFPEILVAVLLTTVMCSRLQWASKGVEVVGSMPSDAKDFAFHNPLSSQNLRYYKKLSTSGFVCAMLGFFESTTALKSLGSRYDLPISSNRELVALGFINVVGGVFGALPAFGGYGRSKINAMSARTTTSGAIMGVISILTARYILVYLHNIPKCVLSVITAVIGISLMAETPAELKFHWQAQGYDEILTFALTVTTTIFFSMEAGIALGLLYLLLRVIKNSARSNIQILGRVPGTNTFLDADVEGITTLDENSEAPPNNNDTMKKSQLDLFTDNFRQINLGVLEQIEGCLIIKIPEPLTFANASDLRDRLKRVEMFGSAKSHPALAKSRDMSITRYLIFDLEGMLFVDSSASQMLKSLLLAYQRRNIKIFFVRVNYSKLLRRRLENSGILDLLRADIQVTLSCHRVYRDEYPSQPMSLDSALEEPTYWQLEDGIFADKRIVLERSDPYLKHIRSALWLIDRFEQSADNIDA